MPLTVIDHPLLAHDLTTLRDRDSQPGMFRQASRRVSRLLIAEACRALPTRTEDIHTPLEAVTGVRLEKNTVLIPVLRAGLGMLEAALEMIPSSRVGFMGLERDEETAEASTYYESLPPYPGSPVLILDPMLATGGSAQAAIQKASELNPCSITLVCVVAAPEGVAAVEATYPAVNIVAGALDRGLNEKMYIVPGVGDFGDRLYGT